MSESSKWNSNIPFFFSPFFQSIVSDTNDKKKKKKQAETWKLTRKSATFHAKQWPILISKRTGFFFCVCMWCMQILLLKSEMEKFFKYIPVYCSPCQTSPLQLCTRLLLDKSSSCLLSKDLCSISYTHFPKPLDSAHYCDSSFNHCLPLKLKAAFIL